MLVVHTSIINYQTDTHQVAVRPPLAKRELHERPRECGAERREGETRAENEQLHDHPPEAVHQSPEYQRGHHLRDAESHLHSGKCEGVVHVCSVVTDL